MQVPLTVSLACLLLAGCAAPGVQQGATLAGGFLQEADPVLRSVQQPMRLDQGLAVGDQDLLHAWVEAAPSGHVAFDVTPHARQLVVELMGRAEQGQVVLHAIPPADTGAAPFVAGRGALYAVQDGQGRARLVVDDPAPGRWGFDVHAQGSVLGFEGRVYVTSLSCAVEGFSAMPAG